MPAKIRSQDVTEGPAKAGARAMLRAVGLADEDFSKVPGRGGLGGERGHTVQSDRPRAR